MQRHPRHFLPVLLGTLLSLLLVAGLLGSAAPATASVLSGLGTPTAPASPTPPPTATPLPSTATPTSSTPTPTASPTEAPGASPTPRPPSRHEPPADTPVPSATPAPTATPVPEPWTTNVTLEKIADQVMRLPGTVVRYTLRASNDGAHTAFDVVVTDDLPAALQVIDLHSSKGAVVVDGQHVTAYPATLEPGEVVTISITARVRANVRPGPLANVGRITTSTPGDEPSDDTSTAIITIVTAPPQLPNTGDGLLDDPLLIRFLPWLLIGLLLVGLGAALLWRGRPWSHPVVQAVVAQGAPVLVQALAQARTADARNAVRAASTALRIGPPLPPPQPPAALPPPAALDRAAALAELRER